MSIMFGAADWIALHIFRGRLNWPCWLTDWAWSQQATPYGTEEERNQRQYGTERILREYR